MIRRLAAVLATAISLVTSTSAWAACPGDCSTELLNTPIAHELGGTLRVEAVAIDAGGHRTEAVKAYVRARLHAGGELLFCAHHGREHLPKLREHAEIHDESERLHETPASAPDDER